MEDQTLKISVIVPIYNVEAYLDKCVTSLLNQTYGNMDIILVDDGSPDRCPEMCDQYAAEHEHVIALHKQNGGLAEARNYGVQHTDSQWIVFVDSDDYVEPEYVETLVRLKNEYSADMVITRTVRENIDGTGKQFHVPFDSYVANKKKALFQMCSGMGVDWGAYGKLIPKSVLLKHPFPDGYYEDCACMYRIVDEFDRIAIGDFESNYHYIQRDGSTLCSPLNEKHMHIFDIIEEFRKFIEDAHPDLDILVIIMYKRAVVQLLNLQSMPWEKYKEIYMQYRSLFRKNIGRILKDKRITRSDKVYYLLLCGRPEVFYLQRRILMKVR